VGTAPTQEGAQVPKATTKLHRMLLQPLTDLKLFFSLTCYVLWDACSSIPLTLWLRGDN